MSDAPETPEQAPQAAGEQPTIQWDDTDMSSSYANIVNVANSPEEFTLFFGTNQTWHATEDRTFKVHLSDRIILNPHAAKRLLLLLGHSMKRYEERHGAVQLGQAALTQTSGGQ